MPLVAPALNCMRHLPFVLQELLIAPSDVHSTASAQDLWSHTSWVMTDLGYAG